MPPILRQAVGGAREVDASGATVREVLADLADRFPGVRSHLLDESGDLNRFVNVYVNNEDVRLGDGMDTAVSTDSTLLVLPAMARRTRPSSCCRRWPAAPPASRSPGAPPSRRSATRRSSSCRACPRTRTCAS